MTDYYLKSPLARFATPDARYGRPSKLAEPTLAVIERAIGIQLDRAQNETLTPADREEAGECLKRLAKQYTALTGRPWRSVA